MIEDRLRVLIVLSVLFIVGSGQNVKSGLVKDSKAAPQLTYQATIIREVGQCVGSIVGNHHVITSASCITDADGKLVDQVFEVLVGIDYKNEHFNNSIVTSVKKISIPKKFNKTSHIGDIAVLKIGKSLKIKKNLNISKLTLPHPSNFTLKNKTVYTTGLGWDDIDISRTCENMEPLGVDGTFSKSTNIAKMNVLSKKSCEDNFEIYKRLNSNNVVKVEPEFICSEIDTINKFSTAPYCVGEQGAPLVANNKMLAGVLTYGFHDACNMQYQPNLYVDVAQYRDFIQKAMDDVEDPEIITQATNKTFANEMIAIAKEMNLNISKFKCRTKKTKAH